MFHRTAVLVIIVPLLGVVARCHGADRPQYRADAARSASTADGLPQHFHRRPRWVARLPEPRPAWPRSDRMAFDRAPQPIIANGTVFLGHSADGTLYAIDLASGGIRWRFTTQAPIRFAPVAWRDLVMVGSDDGHVYALRQSDGRLAWRFRAAPADDLVLGNGRVISKWPVRGGPVLADDTLYVAAGIWPSEGVLLYALDPADGSVRWKNDKAGAIYMGQPHGGAYAESGVAAQGHLVVSGNRLLVPTGRAVPAVFDRRTGKFLFFHLQRYGQRGGALAMAVGDVFFNQGWGYDTAAGAKVLQVDAELVAAADNRIDAVHGRTLRRLQWKTKQQADRRGKQHAVRSLEPIWTTKLPFEPTALAVARGESIIGGRGTVAVVHPKTRRIRFRAPVSGTVHGIAAADEQLIVTTDKGTVVCFGAEEAAARSEAKRPFRPSSTGSHPWAMLRTKITEPGYCVVLAYHSPAEIIALTSLKQTIVVFEPDARRVAELRNELAAEVFDPSRVSIWQRSPVHTGLPDYVANVVVCAPGRRWTEAQWSEIMSEAKRLQRPYGGTIAIRREDHWELKRRGALSGAGTWTHQYADPANRLNSGDRIVQADLTMHWFRDVAFGLPQRHGRGPAPLFADGLLVHEGLDGLICVDAYNGTERWRYELPGVLQAYDGDQLMGVSGTGSNFCIAAGRLFVRHGTECDELSLETGRRLRRFVTPADDSSKSAPWGYIASDGKRLYGTEADPSHVVTYRYVNRGGDMRRQLTESKAIFAYDLATGKLLWRYAARDSIRHNAIAVAQDRVVLIDRPQAPFDRTKRPQGRAHPFGRLVALDARTGDVEWHNDREIFGTVLIADPWHDALVMCYQPTRFRLDSERGDRIAVLRWSDGKRLWDQPARYASRPFIVEDAIYAQGAGWDLLSGKPRPFPFKRSYGCGILAASQNLLLFRSATLGYCPLADPAHIVNYGGLRPGCWINALPVGGLVVMPDASAGCRCSYLNQAWIALGNRRPHRISPANSR